jgi:protein TonB
MALRISLAGSALSGRRRALLAFVASLAGHGLVAGATTLVLAHPMERPLVAKPVEVEVIARVEPVHLPPPAEQPAKEPASAPPRAPLAKPHAQARPQVHSTAPSPPAAPATLTPDSPSSDASEVALPVSAVSLPRKEVASPSLAAPPGPTVNGSPGPITVVAVPRYRSNPAPEYPAAAKRRREEGEVRLRVTVSPDGRPLRVSLFRSSGHALLDQAAMDAVLRWTFEPARAAGEPVEDRVIVPVRFSLSRQ